MISRLLKAWGGAGTPARDAAFGLPVSVLAQRLFWFWLAMTGLAVFVFHLLDTLGWWNRLIDGDPSRITLVIIALTMVVTLWCGRRAWLLQAQAADGSAWRRRYTDDRLRAPDQASALLTDIAHGPHETAWWFASSTIKLGLLGTVVGFIIMASRIGEMPSFDIEQVQELLRQMTTGMAVALYTTLVGLAANLWLGLQLLLLDRMADRIVADIVAHGQPAAAVAAV